MPGRSSSFTDGEDVGGTPPTLLSFLFPSAPNISGLSSGTTTKPASSSVVAGDDPKPKPDAEEVDLSSISPLSIFFPPLLFREKVRLKNRPRGGKTVVQTLPTGRKTKIVRTFRTGRATVSQILHTKEKKVAACLSGMHRRRTAQSKQGAAQPIQTPHCMASMRLIENAKPPTKTIITCPPIMMQLIIIKNQFRWTPSNILNLLSSRRLLNSLKICIQTNVLKTMVLSSVWRMVSRSLRALDPGSRALTRDWYPRKENPAKYKVKVTTS